MEELIKVVTETYLSPTERTSDRNGRMCLYRLAAEFDMMPIKVRKLFITSGAYRIPISKRVGELLQI